MRIPAAPAAHCPALKPVWSDPGNVGGDGFFPSLGTCENFTTILPRLPSPFRPICGQFLGFYISGDLPMFSTPGRPNRPSPPFTVTSDADDMVGDVFISRTAPSIPDLAPSPEPTVRI